jgi:uncharacterized paraquat-inducible protein A
MARNDLDNILTEVECPSCGTVIALPYRQLRVVKAAACKCATLLILVDDTSAVRLESLIDSADLMNAAND